MALHNLPAQIQPDASAVDLRVILAHLLDAEVFLEDPTAQLLRNTRPVVVDDEA